LLIQKAEPMQEMASSVTAEHVDTLPETASPLPLVGGLGLLGILSSLGMGAVRRLAKVRS
jgi:hypothetical protein